MGEDIGVIRKRKGMSVNQLAAKSGVPMAALIQYEKGAREIPATDRSRLAKALYVSEWDINPQSTPPPPPPPPKPTREEKPAKPPQEKKQPRKSPPARESQIAHLLTLAARFEVDRAALEAEIGKPLDELTQQEARHWNGHYMRRMAEEKPPKSPIDRKRAYLPEGVDGFELAYLQELQESEAPLHFTLFDGQTFEGVVVGFGPYHIDIREPGGDEVMLNKLAIAYYRRPGGAE